MPSSCAVRLIMSRGSPDLISTWPSRALHLVRASSSSTVWFSTTSWSMTALVSATPELGHAERRDANHVE